MDSMERMERRRVLAGLAAAPALLTLHATSASALASTAGTSPADGARYFPWPLLQPGSTIDWPTGAVAFTADRQTQVSLADISKVPARGAPSGQVYLTGFGTGTRLHRFHSWPPAGPCRLGRGPVPVPAGVGRVRAVHPLPLPRQVLRSHRHAGHPPGPRKRGSGMSDHFDSPATTADPSLDISDFYAFKGRSGRTVFIINTNPLSGTGGFWVDDHHGPVTSAHYNIKISRAGTTTPDLCFRATFGKALPLLGGAQPMTLTMLTGKDADDEDARGQILGAGLTGGEALDIRCGVRFWAGAAGDPFYIEPHVIGAAETAINNGAKLDLSGYDPANPVNVFAGTNVMSIVIEVPKALTGTREIACWADVRIPADAGGWRQIDRAGQPLAAILGHLTDDTYNAASPRDDIATFGAMTENLVAAVVTANGTSNDPAAYAARFTKAFLPDLLRYTPGTTANYSVGGDNGRDLVQNVPEVVWEAIFGMPVSDGLDASSATGQLRDRFPYLSKPG